MRSFKEAATQAQGGWVGLFSDIYGFDQQG